MNQQALKDSFQESKPINADNTVSGNSHKWVSESS